MVAIQAHRTIAVASPLGPDVLLFRSLQAEERLSEPFTIRLQLLSEDDGIAFESVLGQPLVVRVLLLATLDQVRYFHGLVSEFRQVKSWGRYATYEATLRPWLWFLSRTSDCRIFQNMAVPDIVMMLFREHGFTDVEWRLSETYPPREYCVQYRETTFNFVSRLLEEEGIYYYFRHEVDKHVLVLADALSAHAPVIGYEQLRYQPSDCKQQLEYISDWTVARRVQPGRYAHTDFDFKIPRKDLLRRAAMPREHALSQYEIYDYPGAYVEARQGEAYARVRLEELQAQYETITGQSNARGLAVGHLFSLQEHPRADWNREYLLVSTLITLISDQYQSHASGEPEGELYDCTFTVLESSQPYRPVRLTPKPLVQGPQTATVVGKTGEEIWTDEYGRVKCQFHWDRYGQTNENSSCWVRVSQPWAGKGWGGISIPRIGQEVIVDFLEGDPDQPIITGRVYNGASMPPYALPAGAVVSGLKSNTVKGSGYNEICMNDTSGSELLQVHAQYDMASTVGHDQQEQIGNNRMRQVGNDEIVEIGNNRAEKIGVNASETVGTNKVVDVGSNFLIKAGTSITLQCGASTIHMNQAGIITITGTMITVAGAINTNVTAPITTITGILLNESGVINLNNGGLVRVDGGVTSITGGPVNINN